MAALQILVQGEPLDLNEGESTRFFVTKIIQDLGDLSTRNSDATNTINIPITDVNLRLLDGQVPERQRFNDEVTTNIQCEVLANGIPLLQDAYFLISSQTEKEFALTIFSGTSKFFSALSEQPIGALNLSALDLDWTLTDVTAIVDESEGIVYADSQWFTNESYNLYDAQTGGVPPNLVTRIDEMELAESGFFIYCKTILEAIFASIPQLSFDISAMDSRFDTIALAIPVPILHDQFTSLTGVYEEVRNTTGNALTSGRVVFPTETVTGVLWNNVTDEYDLPAGTYTVRCRFETEIRFVTGILYNVYQDGVLVASTINDSAASQAKQSNREILTTVTVATTSKIYVEIAVIVTGNGYANIDFGQFSVEEQGLGRGTRVVVADFLPEISQRSFVKEVFNLFNIIPLEQNNLITLEYFDNITKAERPIKLDISKSKKSSTTLLSYGQTSRLKYSDNEAVSREDADSFFDVDSLTIQQDVTVIQSIFSATDDSVEDPLKATIPNYTLVYNFNGINTLTVAASPLDQFTTLTAHGIEPGDYIAIDANNRRKVISVPDSITAIVDVAFTGASSGSSWHHWTQEKEDLQIHLALISQNPVFTNTIINDGGTKTANLPSFKRASFGSALKWENLKDDYYQVIVRSLGRPYVVEAWTSMSVLTLLESSSVLQAVYIESLNGWFYVNRFEQWKLDNSVRLELIEVNI